MNQQKYLHVNKTVLFGMQQNFGAQVMDQIAHTQCSALRIPSVCGKLLHFLQPSVWTQALPVNTIGEVGSYNPAALHLPDYY